MSLKSNELRVGNYVKGIGHKISWLVDGIETEYIYSSKAWRLMSSFEGIELTAELLKYFGFKLVWAGSGDGSLYRFGEKCNTMELINRGYGFKYNTFNACEIEIKYVHQLQNLYFALTGEELTITC